MFAHRRMSVENWDFEPKENHYQVKVTRGGKALKGVDPKNITHLEERLMRWWKANHIHKWFVDNVQDGEDDCASYELSKSDLCELHRVCTEVIKASKLIDGTVYIDTEYSREHPEGKATQKLIRMIEDASVAKKLLPTTSGCFFGSKEYNEYYLQDVIDTHAWVEKVLADFENGVKGDIVYSSSW